MSIVIKTDTFFKTYLNDLAHGNNVTMLRSEYQLSRQVDNVDILMYNRLYTGLIKAYNTFVSDEDDKWTKIRDYLIDIRDTCLVRLTHDHWIIFDACLTYVKTKIAKNVKDLLSQLKPDDPEHGK
jgi:hypothetical protein